LNLVEALKSFNSKERFFLIGWALGNPPFKLSQSFRGELGSVLNIPVPPNAYAAMDYHLDWIYASLYLTARADDDAIHVNTSRKQISATQEDVDLLVAFEVGGVFHLIMLEAKGATGWTNRQLAHKASRLRAIFGDSGTSWQSVVPHFVIASPVESSRLLSADWPGWMTDKGRPVWLPMQMPSLRRITRCDERGRPSVNGTCWTVVKRGAV
jgi:hypothetical protein